MSRTRLVAAALAFLAAAAPYAAAAQTRAPGAHPHHAQTHRGSYRSEMRNRHSMHKQRARAGAEHVRQTRMQ